MIFRCPLAWETMSEGTHVLGSRRGLRQIVETKPLEHSGNYSIHYDEMQGGILRSEEHVCGWRRGRDSLGTRQECSSIDVTKPQGLDRRFHRRTVIELLDLRVAL